MTYQFDSAESDQHSFTFELNAIWFQIIITLNKDVVGIRPKYANNKRTKGKREWESDDKETITHVMGKQSFK